MSIKILVCVKQVVDPETPTSAFRVDSGSKRVIPAIGIPSLSLMAYDYYKISGHPNILCIKKAYSENVYWGEFNISE